MCGITAVYNIKNAPREVLDLIVQQDSRGKDATGIAYINKNNSLTVVKKAIPPKTFVEKFGKAISSIESFICIGHNRMASTNIAHRTEDKESHPFISEDGTFALVHNGTYMSYKILGNFLDKLGHTRESGVDTEVFVHVLEELLEKYPRDEAIMHFYGLSEGNILILFDDGTLYGIPSLSFVGMKINGGYFIASETDTLVGLLEKFKKGIGESVNIIIPSSSGSLLKIYLTEDNKVKAKLFGEWKETVLKYKDWILDDEHVCDFCGERSVPCQRTKMNNVLKDRCLKCYKEGKTELHFKTIANELDDYEGGYGTQSGHFGHPGRSTIVRAPQRNLSSGIVNRGMENVLCSSCKTLVKIDKATFCTRCSHYFCDACISVHKCKDYKNKEIEMGLKELQTLFS